MRGSDYFQRVRAWGNVFCHNDQPNKRVYPYTERLLTPPDIICKVHMFRLYSISIVVY